MLLKGRNGKLGRVSSESKEAGGSVSEVFYKMIQFSQKSDRFERGG